VELLVKGLVVVAMAVSSAYAFVKVLDASKSFARALLAVSALVDFYLILLWLLGIDRPLFTIFLQRIGASVAVTALSLFIPMKVAFTLWLWLKTRERREL